VTILAAYIALMGSPVLLYCLICNKYRVGINYISFCHVLSKNSPKLSNSVFILCGKLIKRLQFSILFTGTLLYYSDYWKRQIFCIDLEWFCDVVGKIVTIPVSNGE